MRERFLQIKYAQLSSAQDTGRTSSKDRTIILREKDITYTNTCMIFSNVVVHTLVEYNFLDRLMRGGCLKIRGLKIFSFHYYTSNYFLSSNFTNLFYRFLSFSTSSKIVLISIFYKMTKDFPPTLANGTHCVCCFCYRPSTVFRNVK